MIVLPDDEASLADASAYRAQGEQLFSYEPRPRIPQWLRSLVRIGHTMEIARSHAPAVFTVKGGAKLAGRSPRMSSG